jgi:hypothetical protein
MYLGTMERMKKWYRADLASGKITIPQMRQIAAREANAAFGGQNLERMGRNKTLQDLVRLGALAPDFTEARGRFAGQALRPYGREQLMALGLRLGVMQYLGVRLLNMASNNGDPIWDPKYMFSVKVGKHVYNIRTISGDIKHLFEDPNNFLFFRSSPAVRLMGQMAAKSLGGKKLTVPDLVKDVMPIPGQGAIDDLVQKGKLDQRTVDSLFATIGVQRQKYYTKAEQQSIEQHEEAKQKSLQHISTGGRGRRISRNPKGF